MATVFVNDKFEIVHASDKWKSYFDLDSVAICGKPILEILPETAHGWETILPNCLSGEHNTSTIKLNNTNVSKIIWLKTTSIPWYDEQENVIGLIIQAENISEKKLLEKQHNKLESILKVTCEVGKIGCWEYCLIEDKMVWCSMTRLIHEVDKDHTPTIETSVQFYKEGHSRNTISMVIHEAMINGISYSERLQIVTAKGNEIWVQVSGKPIFQGDKLVGLTGTFQNINDLVQSELKAKESEYRLRTLIDNLPLNVFIKDTESRKILVNKAECAYLGVDSPETILGKTDFELYHNTTAQVARKEDIKVMETLTPILAKENVNRKKNGESTTFLTSKIPLMGTSGKAIGLVGISLDITDFKQKEKELQDLVHVTSFQNKKLLNFAHIVSHNLRSHTANFSMLLDFLSSEKDESEKINILGMLMDASENLSETLENLNEVVDINTNVNLGKKCIPLKNKIDTTLHNLSAYLTKNQATVINQVCDTHRIQAIPAYVDSILMNVITNAVRYKHQRRDAVVTLNTKSENGFTVLSVTDNGLGIDLKKYGSKIFGMYKTFHDNTDARGFGLYIVKNQIEAMNGKVSVDSKVGIGTTFKIYFDERNK